MLFSGEMSHGIFFKMRLKVAGELLRSRPNIRLTISESKKSSLVACIFESHDGKAVCELLRSRPNIRLKISESKKSGLVACK